MTLEHPSYALFFGKHSNVMFIVQWSPNVFWEVKVLFLTNTIIFWKCLFVATVTTDCAVFVATLPVKRQ